MAKVRAVLIQYRNGEKEWLCAVLNGESWDVPDTQCGGYWELDEAQVLKSVDIETDD